MRCAQPLLTGSRAQPPRRSSRAGQPPSIARGPGRTERRGGGPCTQRYLRSPGCAFKGEGAGRGAPVGDAHIRSGAGSSQNRDKRERPPPPPLPRAAAQPVEGQGQEGGRRRQSRNFLHCPLPRRPGSRAAEGSVLPLRFYSRDSCLGSVRPPVSAQEALFPPSLSHTLLRLLTPATKILSH